MGMTEKSRGFPIALIWLVLMAMQITQCEGTGENQRVHIPDPFFLKALIEAGVDENGDGRISFGEAASTLSLDLFASGISDLTGIGAFLNLDSLRISMNPLIEFDISGNIVLRYLECSGCELDSLNISQNPDLTYLDCSGDLALDNYLSSLVLSGNQALEYLNCSGNQITSLNLSGNKNIHTLVCGRNRLRALDIQGNPGLGRVICNNNLLEEIDVSANTTLTELITCGNRLTALDLSNNTRLKKLGIDNMPMLQEVCVWELPFPPPGLVVLMGYSPNVFFTSVCGK